MRSLTNALQECPHSGILKTNPKKYKNKKQKLAATRLAQALQECPHSGVLWSEAILMEPRQQRKAKSVDAIKVSLYVYVYV